MSDNSISIQGNSESSINVAGDSNTVSWQHGVLLPVRIILRDFAASITKDCKCDCHEPLLSYLEKSIRALPGLSDFWQFLYDGLLNPKIPYLILLDGLDEVPTDLRESVVKIIGCFARKYSQHRYLVTCRIYVYIGQSYQLHGFHQATLTPFSKEQIENFVSAWYQELVRRGRLTEKDAEQRAEKLKSAATRPDLIGLSERPLLMTVTALLHTFRGELPDDRIELYQWTTDLLLRRWQGRIGGEKGIVEILNIPSLKMNDLEAGLYDVAFHAHAAGNQEDTADIGGCNSFNKYAVKDSSRVIRGGRWYPDARECRSAHRGFNYPSDRGLNVGFRLVRCV